MQQKRQNTALALVALVSFAIAFAGCGGGGQAASLPSPALPSSPPPGPTLTSLSPSSAVAGGSGFTLTVNGQNLSSSAVVHWNGQAVPTTFVNSGQVTAAISSSLIASAGSVSVSAENQGSLESNILSFKVNNPPPQITSISPDNAMAGAAPLLVTVNGSNFSQGATVLVNGSPRTIYLSSATQLVAGLTADDLAIAGSLAVTAEDTDLATGPSNAVPFTVTPFTTNPTPTLASSLDTSVPAGWPGFQLRVQGTNFVAASVLQWNGVLRQTTVTSSTELKAAIPAALLSSPETAQVAVVNPSPGGGASSTLPIQVEAVPPDAVGVIDRVDIATDLTEPNDSSTFLPAVSRGGRFVVFLSTASNLAPNTPDNNGNYNLFLRDTCVGAPSTCVPSLTLLPSTPDGSYPYVPAISVDGRFVGYSSGSGTSFLLIDTCVAALPGCVPNTRAIDEPGGIGQISLSADGRFAVYLSGSLFCSPWDYGCSLPEGQVFLADTCAGIASGCTPSSLPITPTDVPAVGREAIGALHPSISPDGRYVTFNSSQSDIWLYDTCQGAIGPCSPSKTMVSVATDGSAANGDSFGAAVSAGGRYVTFLSLAGNLAPGVPQPGVIRLYFRDMCTGVTSGCTLVTTFVTIAGDGVLAADPSISADGRYIAFAFGDASTVPAGTEPKVDIFVSDTCAGVLSGCTPSITRVSVALDGTQGNTSAPPSQAMISADGHFVVFQSVSKLAPGGTDTGGYIYLARQ